MNPTPTVTGLLIYAAEDAPHFDCPICMKMITKPDIKILTSCSHLFCEHCVLATQRSKPSQDHIKCPLCRMQLRKLVQRPIPLERTPLKKIRMQHIWGRYAGMNIQRRIDCAPERIAYQIQVIKDITKDAIAAEGELIEHNKRMAAFEEQIARRQRTNRTKRAATEAVSALAGGEAIESHA